MRGTRRSRHGTGRASAYPAPPPPPCRRRAGSRPACSRRRPIHRLRRDHCASLAAQIARAGCSASAPSGARVTTAPPRSRSPYPWGCSAPSTPPRLRALQERTQSRAQPRRRQKAPAARAATASANGIPARASPPAPAPHLPHAHRAVSRRRATGPPLHQSGAADRPSRARPPTDPRNPASENRTARPLARPRHRHASIKEARHLGHRGLHRSVFGVRKLHRNRHPRWSPRLHRRRGDSFHHVRRQDHFQSPRARA